MHKTWAIGLALLLLTSCGSASDNTSDGQSSTVTSATSAELGSAQPAAAQDGTSGTQPNVAEGPRNLAKVWGFDGYVRCSYYGIALAADAVKQNRPDQLKISQTMMQVQGMVKPLINPAADDSLIGPALRAYQAEHMGEAPAIATRNLEQCLKEIGQAFQI
jgi:hypothetical protein